MNLALFDLDHTLLPLDSDHAFGEFMVRIGWADGEAFRTGNDAFYRQYLAGRLDIEAYIDFTTRPWRGRTEAERAAAHRRFMDEVITPQLKPAALQLVERHREQGDAIAIVTATNEFVTRPIAAAFGVAELIGVELHRDDAGNITGRIHGVPSYQAADRDERVQRYDLTETRASTPPSPFKACATIPERKNLYFLRLKEDSNPIPTSGTYSLNSV